MPTTRSCPGCGTALPAETGGVGACPRCAFQGALDLSDARLGTARVEQVGDRIGRYELLERIGEGGCGVVYLAEQTEPIRRRVALKVVKLGMDTRRVIARFEAERQALALMDHPHIARVIDAGASDSGRPFFVMELVSGLRITDYCAQHNLPTRARLWLFIQVCRAVQHAHQKGIIHRDLKPSNILVSDHEGEPVPKIIDFGIAKATHPPSSEESCSTSFQQFIGTPAYMSPEQAGLSAADVDTRSDVYALGVLLYELLTGHTPFDQKELGAAGVDAMRRLVQEKEPPRPSLRLASLSAAELRAVAGQQRAEPRKLMQVVRGDLDWIVMKCLEKDRQRRYATAHELARDVERYLSDEPVTAAAPRLLYQLNKLVRRHRAGLAISAALAFLLLAGVVASTWQAVRATRAEREQSRLRSEAEKARQEAEEQKLRVEEALHDVSAQQIRAQSSLAEAERERAEKQRALQESQEQRTNTLNALAATRRQQAIAEDALQRASNAWSTAHAALQDLREEQTRLEEAMDFMLFDLSEKLRPNGRVDLLRTVTERVLSHYRSLPDDDSDSSLSRRFLAYKNLGHVLSLQGDSAKALEAYQDSLALAVKRCARDPENRVYLRELSICHERIGALNAARGEAEEALQAFNRSLEIAQRLAAWSPQDSSAQVRLVISHVSVGDVLWDLADKPKARASYETALTLALRLVQQDPDNGPGQHSLSTAYTRLGSWWLEEGALDQATDACRRALEITQRFAAANPADASWQSDLANNHDALADVCLARQDPKNALAHYQEALRIRQRLAEVDPSDTACQRGLLRSYGNLGRALAHENRKSKAFELFLESVRWVVDNPRKHLRLAQRLFSADHRNNEPLEAFRESVKVARQLADTDAANRQWQEDLARCHSLLGEMLLQAGEKENALQEYLEALQIREQLAAGDNPAPHLQCALAVAHADVALALRRLSHHAEALVQARQTLDLVAALLCRWPGNSVLLSSPRLHGKNLHPGLAFRSEQQDAVLAAFRRGFAGAQRTAA
ncbi:MAG TPA: protein kinase, partial [Verrucomicrobiae bacterium]|nr:protein kinase [Verrucomicrobiae bacterium]